MADMYKEEAKTKGADGIDFEKIKKRATEIEAGYSEQHRLFKRYREIYFMDNVEQPKNAGVDKNDWKLTASPSGRNEVTGMKRLLDTGEIHVEIKSEGKTIPSSDKIEEGLKSILRVSGELQRTRVHKDANLSAVLYGPVALRVEAVSDLLIAQNKPTYKKRLMQIQKRSPFLISAINAENSYPDWGKFGMLAHVEKYDIRGSEIKETWGYMDCDDNTKYTVHDYIDLENRVVWVDGKDKPLFKGPHNLVDMNVIVRYAGGSSLFFKPEEQLQSFLYAKAKGEWDKRENLLWTYIFTAIYQQGLPGRTLLVDSTDNTQPTVDIDYSSGVKRIIVTGARATPMSMDVIDGDILQIKNMMDDVSGDSTIRGSTLGENIKGATFSALSMLSSAGKLPMIDPQEAVQQAFSGTFLHILERIRDEGIENELIQPADIPADVEVKVTIEAKLPQDNLRNAQVASALGDKVSDEWIHTNLLQIGNTEEMHRQMAKENIKKAMLAKIAQDPQYIDEFIKAALGVPTQPPPQQGQPPQGPQGPMPPEGMSPEMMGQMDEQGGPPMSPEQMALMAQGGGMEQMPQGGPMIPMEERM